MSFQVLVCERGDGDHDDAPGPTLFSAPLAAERTFRTWWVAPARARGLPILSCLDSEFHVVVSGDGLDQLAAELATITTTWQTNPDIDRAPPMGGAPYTTPLRARLEQGARELRHAIDIAQQRNAVLSIG